MNYGECEMNEREELDFQLIADKLTSLGESEMQLFRFLLDRPVGAILTADTDIMLAELLAAEDLLVMEEGNKVFIPAELRDAYRENWTDELTLRWRKRNWMYMCLETGKYLYGVMTWDVLKELFAIRYPHAEMDEIRELFESTPNFYQWFTEREGKLVLNGYEQDDYWKYLEKEIQADIPFYIPKREEMEELYNRGSLLSRESHTRLKDFIVETWDCGEAAAELKMRDLYAAINNRKRLNDAAEEFEGEDGEKDFAFPSDEIHVKFIELLMEMSRECRTRDNRGHDWYEMTGIMAARNKTASAAKEKAKTPVKRVKIGRNDPCPCGSGKKYKNCCGKN